MGTDFRGCDLRHTAKPYVSEEELRDIEAEFGHPLTGELAQWFIRNWIHPESDQTEARPKVQRVHKTM